MADNFMQPQLDAMQNAIAFIMRKKQLDEDKRQFDNRMAEMKVQRQNEDMQKMAKIKLDAKAARVKYLQGMMKTAYEKGDQAGLQKFGSKLSAMGFTVPGKAMSKDMINKATPTDVDDFVSDANAEAMRISGRPLTPGQRNEARLKFKRAQATEIRMNRLASRTVDAQTAQRIKYNEGIGKRLAEIETAGALLKAKGEETPQQKQDIAKNRMTGNLATMANHYIKLDSMGAILNVDKPGIDNVGAAIQSSAFGQSIGRITGSDAQSIRSSINKIKPLLIQDIRQSTNMSARGLDSEKELEFYLQAATDEKTDIQSNIAAIVVLDEAYGTGETAKQLRSLTDESLIKRIATQGSRILNRGGKAQEKPRFKITRIK